MTKGFVKGVDVDVELMYILQGDLDIDCDTYLWSINGLTVIPAAGPRFQRNGVLGARNGPCQLEPSSWVPTVRNVQEIEMGGT